MRVRARSSAALLAGLALCQLPGCTAPEELPTAKVERRDFAHRITAEGSLRARNAIAVTVPSEVQRMSRIVWLAEEGSEVEAGDVVARFDPTEMEQRLEEGEASLSASELRIGKARVEGSVRVSEIDKNRRVAGLELEVAQRYEKRDADIYSRVEIAESEIDQELAHERRTHAERVRPVQESLSRSEVEILQVERRRAEHDVEQAQEGLAALEVRAPHSGILTWTRDWQGDMPQIGDQVWRGQQLGEIPDLASMEAEVFVLEADAGGLAPGKPASVVVEAHPDRSYEASIERIDSVAKRRYRGSPVQYFGVLLSLATTDAATMKPGQRVRARLTLAEVPAALVIPRQAIYLLDGFPHVRVLGGVGVPEPRRVNVGPQSLGLCVIEEGLDEGDVVVLEPPESADDEKEDETEEPYLPGFGATG